MMSGQVTIDIQGNSIDGAVDFIKNAIEIVLKLRVKLMIVGGGKMLWIGV